MITSAAAGKKLPVVLFLLLALGCSSSSDPKAGLPRFLHCPRCHMEMPYTVPMAGQTCPRCGPGGPRLVATYEAGAVGNPIQYVWGKLIIIGLFLAVLAEAGVYFWACYKKHRKVEEEVYLRVRCRACKRKLAYSIRLVGAEIKCSRCKTPIVLPALGSGAEERTTR